MAVSYHRNDLPEGLHFGDSIAVDSETMGLNLWRDRLCVVQLSGGDGNAHVVHFPDRQYAAPNLRRLLADHAITKIFHFARFDLAMIQRHFAIACAPVYCTKLASRLCAPIPNGTGSRISVPNCWVSKLSKQQQTSDWGAPVLDEAQLAYAASDVLHLHALRKKLDELLEREGRKLIAEACFQFLRSAPPWIWPVGRTRTSSRTPPKDRSNRTRISRAAGLDFPCQSGLLLTAYNKIIDRAVLRKHTACRKWAWFMHGGACVSPGPKMTAGKKSTWKPRARMRHAPKPMTILP